jgi:hypothetical protein
VVGREEGLGLFPLFPADASLSQDTAQQRYVEISLMWIGKNDSESASTHILMPASGEGAFEA